MDTQATPTNLEQDPDYERIRALLYEVDHDKHFYPSALRAQDNPDDELLRRLVGLELLRWCPYPEEFYVILPLGKQIIGSV